MPACPLRSLCSPYQCYLASFYWQSLLLLVLLLFLHHIHTSRYGHWVLFLCFLLICVKKTPLCLAANSFSCFMLETTCQMIPHLDGLPEYSPLTSLPIRPLDPPAVTATKSGCASLHANMTAQAAKVARHRYMGAGCGCLHRLTSHWATYKCHGCSTGSVCFFVWSRVVLIVHPLFATQKKLSNY